MSNSRTPQYISLVALLIITAGAAFYFLGPYGAKRPPEPVVAGLKTAPVEPTKAAPAPGLPKTDVPAEAATDQAAERPENIDSGERRQNLAARRAGRYEAYSKLPPEKRARTLAKQWGLSEQQEKDIARIMARYSEELAALEQQNLSDTEKAKAQQQIQRQQMQEIAPVVSESPGVREAMQRFMAAAKARGGVLVTPQSK